MTTQSVPTVSPVTLAEYARLPKHPRYELVKGGLIELMVASDEPEEAVILTGMSLGSYVYPTRMGKVYGSNRGYVTGPASPATSRMPDVSFVSNARLDQPDLAGMLYDGAPDLAVEIRSESNTPAEIAQKVAECLNDGGKAVWVIDLDSRTLTVHTADAPSRVLADADTVDGGDVPAGVQLCRGRPAARHGRLNDGGAPTQGYAVGQGDGGFEVPEHQESAHRHRHLLGVLRNPRRQVQLDVAVFGRLIGFKAPAAADVGIDRYLKGFTASTFPADEVDGGLASFVANELGGFGGYVQVSGHGFGRSSSCPSQGALGCR